MATQEQVRFAANHGVFIHLSKENWYGKRCCLYCASTGQLLMSDSETYVRNRYMRINGIDESKIVFEHEGPLWANPIPYWPDVSFEEANRFRDEYREKWQ